MAFLPSNHPLSRLRGENDIVSDIETTADQISELAGCLNEWLIDAPDTRHRTDRATTLLGLIIDLAEGIHGHTEALARRFEEEKPSLRRACN